MQIWNGISERLFSPSDPSPYAPWNTVERRIRSFRDFLMMMKGRAEAKQASQQIVELLPLFEQERFDLTGEYAETFDYVRTLLLDIWDILLNNLDNVTTPDANNFYKAIAFLMRRKEFDVTYLKIDENFELDCSERDLRIARRYRHLLYATQTYVATKLSIVAKNLANNKPGPPLSVYAFFAKVLAVNYFRLMGLSRTLLGAVVLSDQEKDFLKEVVEKTEENFSKAEQDMSILSSFYPNLFQWNQFHSVLAQMDSEDEKLRQCPKEWLEEFGRRDLLFFLFVVEWILVVKQNSTPVIRSSSPTASSSPPSNTPPVSSSPPTSSITPSSPSPPSPTWNWYSIKGYREFVQAVLFAMKSKEMTAYNRVLTDCLTSLVVVEPPLINFYMYFTFSRTNVYDTTAVMETLGYVDVWFRELLRNDKRLSNDFDSAYFCKAISIMFETEHHQLILRVLTLLYNYAEIFSGKITRKAVLIDLLLKQYFFKMFLHWESTIRNAFQQILVFKMLREKRSKLHQQGFLTDADQRPRKAGSDDTLHEDYELDGIIHAKIESYLQLLQAPGESYPANWMIYAKQSLSDYGLFMQAYEAWEKTGERCPPLQLLHN